MVELRLEKAFNFLKDRNEHAYFILQGVQCTPFFFILNIIYKYFVILNEKEI